MATQTSVNNEFKNNLLVSESTAAATAAVTVSNTDNSDTGSHAKMIISTGGASGGDAFIHFDNNVVDVTMGIDNSDSDAFVISKNATLGTTNVAHCTSDGEWNYPLQSGFSAYPSTTATNVTGNGGWHTEVNNTELFDINSDFNTGTYKFTAPVDGVYLFCAASNVIDTSTASEISIELIATSGTFQVTQQSTGNNGARIATGALHILMDAADTMYKRMAAWGEASNRNDVELGSNRNHFSGVLLQ